MSQAIKKLDDLVWILEKPFSPFGIRAGLRMSIIKTTTGLILYSPVRITDSEAIEIEKLGAVRVIIAPNAFHHLFLKQAVDRYPDAEVWAADGVQQKQKWFNGKIISRNSFPKAFESGIDFEIFNSIKLSKEVVLFHRASKTLFVTDLFFNFRKPFSIVEKIFWAVWGVSDKRLSLSRLIKILSRSNRKDFNQSLKNVLSFDFSRLVVTHGEMLESAAKPQVIELIENNFG